MGSKLNTNLPQFVTDALPLSDLITYRNGQFFERGSVTPLPKEDALDLYRWYLEQAKSEFKKEGLEVLKNPNNLLPQLRMKEKLKDIHLVNAILGNDGLEGLNSVDYLEIGNTLKAQYGLIDNSPKPYGLKYLIEDIKRGDVSEAKLNQRLDMYAASGEISRDKAEVNSKFRDGYTLAKRVLGATHKHCDDCIRYAALGFVGIKSLPVPKTKCKCLSHCLCSIVYQKEGE